MKTKHTLFLLGLFLLIVSCEKSHNLEKRGDNSAKEIAAYIPENATVVAYANLKNIKNSALYTEHKQEFSHDIEGDYLQFVNATGFDIKKDLDECMVFASDKNAQGDFLLVGKGTFVEEKIIAFIKEKSKEDDVSIEEKSINSQNVYVVSSKKQANNKKMAIAFSNGIVFLGKADQVIAAVGNKMERQHKHSEKINALAGYDVFTVVDAKTLADRTSSNHPYANKLNLIDKFTFAMNVDEMISLKIIGECLEEIQAKELLDVAKGAVAMGRLLVSQERDLVDLMNEIDVEQQGKNITISASITKDRLKQLKKYKEKLPLKRS